MRKPFVRLVPQYSGPVVPDLHCLELAWFGAVWGLWAIAGLLKPESVQGLVWVVAVELHAFLQRYGAPHSTLEPFLLLLFFFLLPLFCLLLKDLTV